MFVKVIVPPSSEPFTVEEIKTYLRVDGNDEDGLIGDLITSARDFAQSFTNRQLMPATFEAVMSFADYQKTYVKIPVSPFLQFLTFKYFDSLEVERDFLETEYKIDTYQEPVRIDFLTQITESEKLYPVKITFTAGYEIGKIPGSIKRAMLFLIAKWYAYREDFAKKQGISEAEHLMWNERVVPI